MNERLTYSRTTACKSCGRVTCVTYTLHDPIMQSAISWPVCTHCGCGTNGFEEILMPQITWVPAPKPL